MRSKFSVALGDVRPAERGKTNTAPSEAKPQVSIGHFEAELR